ncbi:MAG: DinB family protein [Candidatus Sulfotelmatobacter sp.]
MTSNNISERALTELLHGKGAHADPVACVEDLSEEPAARQVAGFPHSIGQLVFHMNYWMDYELRRIRGESPKYPEHNSESFPPSLSPVDAQEWDRLRKTFTALLSEFATLAKSSPQDMQRQIESVHDGDKKVAGTLEAVLWQMVAHNSYHIGQIAMIRRVLGAWPPRGGGDTW